MGLPFLNMFSLDEMFDSLLLMLSGLFLIMFGGWLLLSCTQQKQQKVHNKVTKVQIRFLCQYKFVNRCNFIIKTV